MRLTVFSCACVLAVLVVAPNAWCDASKDAEWKIVGRSDDVTVSTRPFAGSSYPEVRASGIVCAALPPLVAYIEDAAGFDRWIPDTIEARLLAQPSKREQIFYIRTAMPWPVKSRDMIYRLTEPTGQVGGDRMSVSIEGLPDYLPENPDAVRMQDVSGRWNFHERDGVTLIDLDMHFEPGGNIPGWIANRRIVETPTKMLENLQRHFHSSCSQRP